MFYLPDCLLSCLLHPGCSLASIAMTCPCRAWLWDFELADADKPDMARPFFQQDPKNWRLGNADQADRPVSVPQRNQRDWELRHPSQPECPFIRWVLTVLVQFVDVCTYWELCPMSRLFNRQFRRRPFTVPPALKHYLIPFQTCSNARREEQAGKVGGSPILTAIQVLASRQLSRQSFLQRQQLQVLQHEMKRGNSCQTHFCSPPPLNFKCAGLAFLPEKTASIHACSLVLIPWPLVCARTNLLCACSMHWMCAVICISQCLMISYKLVAGGKSPRGKIPKSPLFANW